MDGRVARFGAYEFAFDEMVLRLEGAPVPLQPQPTQVLASLLEKPGLLVSREELKSKVWENRIVDFDAALNFNINQIRRALGDSAAQPKYLETVHRRGYRFIADVEFEVRDLRAPPIALAARPGIWIPVAALVAGVAIAVVASRKSPRNSELEALPPALQATFRAAEWLYEQGDASRALARLDSIRVAKPDFAPAWVLTSHARRAGNDLIGARSAAERAIELEPELADAYYALGLTGFLEVRGRKALIAFEEAVRLAPENVKYRQWYAEALANQLRLDEAIAQLEEARRIDPISNLVGVDLATVYIAAGRFDDAVAYCGGSLELVENAERWARDCLLTAYRFRGESRLAIGQARKLMELMGATSTEAEAVLTLEDYFKWDLARIDRLEATGESVSPFDRVRANARLEDRDETLRGLRSLRQARHYSIQWAPRDAWFWFLRGDPEYEAILREAGLPIPGPSP